MRILTKDNILQLANYGELVEAIIEALKKLEAGKINLPVRSHVNFGGNTLLFMPCWDQEFLSTKLVSVFPGNVKQGLPSIYGSVILNDGRTGRPLALLEGSVLTALRTGAVGGIGVRYTTPKDAKTIGLVGTGVQGSYQLQFVLQERPIEKVFIYHPEPKTALRFKKSLSPNIKGLEISITNSANELVEKSGIIVTATNSQVPVLPDEKDLYQNKHIIAVGSYRPDMQEIPDAVFKNADQIIVDTEHALLESGDVINPVEKGLVAKGQIIGISKIISGKKHLSDSSTTIFKSVGMALFDLAAAQYLFEKALVKGIGTEVEF